MNIEQLATKLAAAEARHTEAKAAFARAEEASARAHELCSDTQKANDNYIATYRAMIRAEAAVVSLKAQIRDRGRERVAADDIKDATHIRTLTGWHKVVRVNAKSVTVATPHSWTDRYRLDEILETRTVVAA